MDRYWLSAAVLAAVVMALAAPAAGQESAQAAFVRHGWMGSWAIDCSRRPSKQNPYAVFRPLGSDHVQRDQVTGAADADKPTVIDEVRAEKSANEFTLSGPSPRGREHRTSRFEGGRSRIMRMTFENGETWVADGRYTRINADTSWVTRCGSDFAPPARAQPPGLSVQEVFERHGLLGSFARECDKLASEQNPYYVYRVLDADHVQHDYMTGPETRLVAVVYDVAIPLGPNEVKIGYLGVEQVLRVERNRSRIWARTLLASGEKTYENGFNVKTGLSSPWTNRCG